MKKTGSKKSRDTVPLTEEAVSCSVLYLTAEAAVTTEHVHYLTAEAVSNHKAVLYLTAEAVSNHIACVLPDSRGC
jgi:hypothetical protein